MTGYQSFAVLSHRLWESSVCLVTLKQTETEKVKTSYKLLTVERYGRMKMRFRGPQNLCVVSEEWASAWGVTTSRLSRCPGEGACRAAKMGLSTQALERCDGGWCLTYSTDHLKGSVQPLYRPQSVMPCLQSIHWSTSRDLPCDLLLSFVSWQAEITSQPLIK